MPIFRRRGGRAEPEPEPVVRRAGRDEISGRLRAASPAIGHHLAANLLPAVRFAVRRVPEAAIDRGGSKLGCSPDLPSGTPWPHCTTSGGERRPLQFVAQIDLAAAAAAAPAPLGFPVEGQLSFFADFDTSGNGVAGLQPDGSAVLYTPPDVPLNRCSPRLPPLPSGQLHPIGVWTWPATGPGHAELPERERSALDALRRELEDELRPEVPELWHGSAHHQLGGHAPLAGAAVAAHSNGAGAGGQAGGWRLILHLDSDPALEVRWASGGSLSWIGQEADVAAGAWGAATFRYLGGSSGDSAAG